MFFLFRFSILEYQLRPLTVCRRLCLILGVYDDRLGFGAGILFSCVSQSLLEQVFGILVDRLFQGMEGT